MIIWGNVNIWRKEDITKNEWLLLITNNTVQHNIYNAICYQPKYYHSYPYFFKNAFLKLATLPE